VSILFSVAVAGDLGAIALAFGVAEPTQTTLSNPGLGATVPAPLPVVLVAVWVLGVFALAILWAARRR
jgi:hypothetical protein